MTKVITEKIASNTTKIDTERWEANAVAVAERLRKIATDKIHNECCHVCPYRTNIRIGGCIGEACPVKAAYTELLKLPRRVRNAAKGIHVAQALQKK